MLSVFSLAIAFFRPLSFRFRLLSFPYFLFPSSRFSLTAVLPVHISSSVGPVAMPFFRFRYSAYCNSFLRMLFCLTVAYFSTSSPLRSISLGLRFRFRILSLETRHLKTYSVRFEPGGSEANLSILPHHFPFVNTFFKKFLKIYNLTFKMRYDILKTSYM